MIQPNLINLHPNEHNQEFAVNLDRCVESCNTLRVCIPNKTEDLNLSVLSMIIGTSASKY